MDAEVRGDSYRPVGVGDDLGARGEAHQVTTPRRQLRKGKGPKGTRESDFWRTPRELFDALHEEFGFYVDLAADRESTLLPNWFGPGSPRGVEDSLYGLREPIPDRFMRDGYSMGWVEAIGDPELDSRVCGFLNCPYSDVYPWGCSAYANSTYGFTTVALLPYTPDARWWDWVEQSAEVRRIPHRVPYLDRTGTKRTTPMFPSCVVIWRPQPRLVKPAPPRYVTWDYR